MTTETLLQALLTRYSVGPKYLVEPGPSDEQLALMVQAALRAPEPLRTQEVLPEMALLLLRVIETARRSSASGRVEPLVPVPDI